MNAIYVVGAKHGNMGDKVRVVRDIIVENCEILRVYTMDGKENGTIPLYPNSRIEDVPVIAKLMEQNQTNEVIATIEKIINFSQLGGNTAFNTLILKL